MVAPKTSQSEYTFNHPYYIITFNPNSSMTATCKYCGMIDTVPQEIWEDDDEGVAVHVHHRVDCPVTMIMFKES